MRKAVLTGTRLHVEDLQRKGGGFRYEAIFLTCTYRADQEWQPGHMTALVNRIREWCRRKHIEFRYQWVMELHKSGRPHYHVVIFVPYGWRLPKPDKARWWRLGATRIERLRHAVGYLAKYLNKASNGLPWPAGARLHGAGGLDSQSRLERSWWMLPLWVREQFTQSDRARKVTGGWLSRSTGELLASPWIIAGRCAEWSWVRLARKA